MAPWRAVTRRKRARRSFAPIGDKIAGIVVTLPNFGDERAIGETIRLGRLRTFRCSFTPGGDDPAKMGIAHRRDSFCGKMSACNVLTQYGIPYSLTSLHTQHPDSPTVRPRPRWFAATCRVVRGLRAARIGAIGARPAAFKTVRYSEKILEASGIAIEPIDLSEILGRVERLAKDDDPHRAHKLERNDQAYVAHRRHPGRGAAQDGEARRSSSTAGWTKPTSPSAPCSAGPRSRNSSASCRARSCR